MKRIFTALTSFLSRMMVVDCPPDQLAGLSVRELADLPVHHPARERDCGCAA